MRSVTARAHANLAFVKYWGKANERLILPQTSSLSLTLKAFYTDTRVSFNPGLTADQVVINHHRLAHSRRIVNFLDLVRKRAHLPEFAKVVSVNHVPTAAGLGSSASGFAALAAAASRAAGLRLNRRELSRLARRGSGSATRSIYGGWVEWKTGNDRTSYALPLNAINHVSGLRVIAMVLNRTQKKIGSRNGMQRCVQTSPYYSVWRRVAANDLAKAITALRSGNFQKLGHVAETNAMRMHALTLSADPPFTYFSADTLQITATVKHLRSDGLECYCTLDAGPNVVIICQRADVPRLKVLLARNFNPERIVVSGSGPGIRYL